VADPPNGKVRIALDAAIILFVIGLSFYSGILTQKVNDLRDAINTRGRVQISIEASNRITALESHDMRQDMRLLELEKQLRDWINGR